MQLPIWLWPNERNPATGLSIRFGRLIHWIFVAMAGAMIAAAIVMAAVALLSSQAWAQDGQASKHAEARNAPHQPKPYVRGQTGTLADVIEQGPDLQPYTPAGPNDFAPPKKSIDWKLLEMSIGVLLGGLLLLLLGRGMRYMFANE